MEDKSASLRNFPIPYGISQIQNPGFYACEPHIPYHITDQHKDMFGKLATMERDSLEAVLSIFNGVKNFVLISDATMQITRTGICEGFKMGERACDMHDIVAEAMLAMEATQAKKLFLRTVGTFSPSSVIQMPEVLIWARTDKVDYAKEGMQGDKKGKQRKKKKKKKNLIVRGARRYVSMARKIGA